MLALLAFYLLPAAALIPLWVWIVGGLVVGGAVGAGGYAIYDSLTEGDEATATPEEANEQMASDCQRLNQILEGRVTDLENRVEELEQNCSSSD